jgi:hypothetical protein
MAVIPIGWFGREVISKRRYVQDKGLSSIKKDYVRKKKTRQLAPLFLSDTLNRKKKRIKPPCFIMPAALAACPDDWLTRIYGNSFRPIRQCRIRFGIE